jgi:hypothetical protein
VDWAVYGPGDFSDTNPYAPPANEYVYAYQIFNASDSVNISKYSIPLMGEADNIGFFLESTDSTGILPNPAFTEIFGSAIWSFNGISFGPGEHSSILLFSSSAPPVLAGSTITDHGSSTEVLPVPTPIPEPASVLVWLIGLGLCLAPAVSRRWKR